MTRKDELVIGLDIGTTKICVVVAERTENGVDIVGIGTHPSRGLRKGVVIDIDNEEVVQLVDTGFTAPFRSLAGIAVFTG